MLDTVIVAGKNNIAINVCSFLLEKKINLYAVLTKNDNGVDSFQSSFKKFCLQNKLRVISLRESYRIDNSIFLSLQFDQIVKPELFSHHRLYNVHFSLLPEYKGMYTAILPLLHQRKNSGVTLHKINQGIDTGDIIEQKKIPLSSDETAESLYSKYIELGTQITTKNLETLLADSFSSYPQTSSGASYYSKKAINYSCLELDTFKTASEIKAQVQAFTFRNYQLLKWKNYTFIGCSISKNASTLKPGTILKATQNKLILASMDFDIVLYLDTLEELILNIKNGQLAEIKHRLTENPLLLKQRTLKGCSPIIIAASYSQFEVVKYLLTKDAKINDSDYQGKSLILYALEDAERRNSIEQLSELIQLSADLCPQAYNGSLLSSLSTCQAHLIKEFFQKYKSHI